MMKSDETTYSIRCPIHPNQEIGTSRGEGNGDYNFGWWCIQCKKHRYFNELEFRKYLTTGFFPVKMVEN